MLRISSWLFLPFIPCPSNLHVLKEAFPDFSLHNFLIYTTSVILNTNFFVYISHCILFITCLYSSLSYPFLNIPKGRFHIKFGSISLLSGLQHVLSNLMLNQTNVQNESGGQVLGLYLERCRNSSESGNNEERLKKNHSCEGRSHHGTLSQTQMILPHFLSAVRYWDKQIVQTG